MSRMFSREPLGNQVKKIVYNVYKHFKKRKCQDSGEFLSDTKLYFKVAEVTGLAKTTVANIVREAKNKEVGKEGRGEPSKPNGYKGRQKLIIDYIIEGIIRRKAIKHGTVNRIHLYLKKENILHCSLENVKKAVLKLGLTNDESINLKKEQVKEPAEVVTERQTYLKTLNFFRENRRSIFYLSETQRWKCESDQLLKIDEMPSYVIIFTSGTQGFLNKANLMLKRKPDDKCFEYFENYDWVKDVVLQNLPPNSVIVMNIPFCETPESISQDKKPSDTLRITLENWLKRHNIAYNQTDPDSVLLDLINSQEAKLEYSIPKILRESGHELLHLPENHLDLDPAAIMWHDIKNCAENVNYVQLASELFLNYAPEKLEECIDYVKQIEAEYSLYFKINPTDPHLISKSENEDSMDRSGSSF
ncbi:hypothetical protein NE865_14597 [Phthorimaea operculella]|nr:hypothetical protein NE865_14597 [Phthorimaea operculella]